MNMSHPIFRLTLDPHNSASKFMRFFMNMFFEKQIPAGVVKAV